MNNSSDFPARLKALRKQAKLTQVKFAKKMFISRGLLNGLETGREKPSAWIVQQVDLLERTGVGLLNSTSAPDPEQGQKDFVVREDQAHYGTSESLVREVRKLVEDTLAAAGDDLGRIGWLREQLLRHCQPPDHWDIHEQIIREEQEREAAEAKRQPVQPPRMMQGGAGR